MGIRVTASTVWEILKTEGIDPAPQRASTTWAVFLRSQAHALLACDFIETITLNGQRQYILAVMSTPPAASVSWAPPHTRQRTGSPNSPETWSWTSTTPARR